jgi:hypothetical protein
MQVELDEIKVKLESKTDELELLEREYKKL